MVINLLLTKLVLLNDIDYFKKGGCEIVLQKMVYNYSGFVFNYLSYNAIHGSSFF